MFNRSYHALVLGLAAILGCQDTLTTPEARLPEVALKKGGKGPGGGPPGDGSFPVNIEFRDDALDNIRSDAEARTDGRGGPYEDGLCGVQADLGNFDDLRLAPDGSYKKKLSKNCGDPRALVFEWDSPDDGGAGKETRIDEIFMNIDHVLTVPANLTEMRKGQFNLCGRLIFNPDDGNGSDYLLVTFLEGDPGDPMDDTWTVRTQGGGNDKGYCEGDGRLWHMPFELTVTRQ